ncbi:Shr3 amino acid permease chaperone [Pisolithus thermaeus]|nr:Shr3 amino acid permease chaperone [Pisolithus thermaeus]
MGFRQGAVLASCSFFLGVLFICFFVDYRILHQPLTDDIIEDGFQFYATFFNAPPAIKALLHGFIGVGILGLVAKLHAWSDSAVLFDGSSLAAYVFAVAVYLSVTIPSLRTIVTPAEVDARADRIEAMRVLAAGNTIMMVVLGAILVLQGGQEYARRLELKELASAEKAEKEKLSAPVDTSAKDKKE